MKGEVAGSDDCLFATVVALADVLSELLTGLWKKFCRALKFSSSELSGNPFAMMASRVSFRTPI